MKQIKEIAEILGALGRRLHDARLERNDSMAVFAKRLGVSERTLRAMERGTSTVQVGTWIEALWVLDRLDEMQSVLAPKESLIERARNQQKPRRQRASKRQRQWR